jgi:hypothetical protein
MHHHTPHVPSATHVRVSLAIHAATFCIVNALLAVINLTSGGNTWFQWPLLGWGIGLAWHAWVVARRVGLWTGATDRRRLVKGREESIGDAGRDRPA